MRIVDVDIAIDKLTKIISVNKNPNHDVLVWEEGMNCALTIIGALPSVDAVEVVRCENCKHYKKSEVSDRMMCWRKDVDGQPVCYDFNPNDFCSYGKRRTDGR